MSGKGGGEEEEGEEEKEEDKGRWSGGRGWNLAK